MAALKVYSQQYKSKLEELYQGRENPELHVFGKHFGIDDVYNCVKNQPFIKTKVVDGNLKILNNGDYNSIYLEKCSTDRGLIQFVKEIEFEKVTLVNSCIKKGKFFRPKFVIDVGTVEPNSKVCINTGYIMHIANMAPIPVIKNLTIIKPTENAIQPSFVVIPQIKCKQEALVPLIFSRDADDRGYYCVSFYTKTGNVGTIEVVLHAFSCVKPNSKLKLIGSKTQIVPIKSKDISDSRHTFNLRTKTLFSKGSSFGPNVTFPTFDDNGNEIDGQSIEMSNCKVLFTSRRREWCMPKIMTLPGYFSSNDRFIKPLVSNVDNLKINVHCCTFVKSPIILFSEEISSVSNISYFNGSFYDVPEYKEIIKCLKHINNGKESFSKAFVNLKDVAEKNNVSLQKLVKLYDYYKCINANSSLAEKVEWDDEKMFNTRPHSSNPISVNLFKGLCKMTKLSNVFTEKECEIITSSLVEGNLDIDILPIPDEIKTPTILNSKTGKRSFTE